MNIDSYIYEAIFEETPKYKVFYELIWEQFKENGFVITDESGYETDAVFKAVALQNLVGEFNYRLYDAVNETGLEDVIEYLANLGIGEEEISEYCAENTQIERDEEDFELTVKNALDYWTEIVADKMLEEFSANDIFDYLFTATYDFEQDFTFDFEDSDEFQAFVDSNSERLDEYKDEYPSVMRWIESGMVC
ncbi:MAG: hypothetical protein K1V95_01285 [Eubacterium sp.]|mgnify:CR=1 FL=1